MFFLTVSEIQSEIMRIKKEKNVCILAHSYQSQDICEVADFIGDSFALSKLATTVSAKTVLMCGVRFMAETVKILSPEKKVFLVNPSASCQMADQMDKEMISRVKERFPEYTVVAYINTTSDLKTICDVCVTSSSAVKIIKKIENENILFIPDCNLGSYVAEQLPEKNIKLLNGCCPVHASVTKAETKKAKELHPNALLLCHPECRDDIVKLADYVGSTSGIMEFAKKSDNKEFIIGTELSILEHLQFECPDKVFYPLSDKLVCRNMRITTLMDLYRCLNGVSGEEIILDDDVMEKAGKCINRMIELGK